jgi:hypothetical protein
MTEGDADGDVCGNTRMHHTFLQMEQRIASLAVRVPAREMRAKHWRVVEAPRVHKSRKRRTALEIFFCYR